MRINKEYRLGLGSVNEVERAEYIHVGKIEPTRSIKTRMLNISRSEESPKKSAERFFCSFYLMLDDENGGSL